MNVRQDVYHVSGAYVRVARFFFLALAVAGLLGTITGVFAQSAQVQVSISNAGCPATSASRGGVGYTCHGTIGVTSQFSRVMTFPETVPTWQTPLPAAVHGMRKEDEAPPETR